MTITRPTTQQRNWGCEITLVKTRTHCGKILYREKGTKGGFQLHVKEESHFLYAGRLLLRTQINGKVEETIVEEGSAWTVPPLTVHQEEALEDSMVFEVSDPTVEDRYAIEPDPGGLKSMTDADAVATLQKLRDAFRLRAEDCDAMAKLIWDRGLAAFAE